MKPPRFEYESPRTLDDALALLHHHQDAATVLAGGQSLMPLLNMRLARPEVIVDINRVAGLDTISITPETVTLGATVRLATVERDEGIRQALPVLASATSWVAHPQIRVRTTVGGTLCHADPSAELPTVAVALGARMRLRSLSGERVVEAVDFFDSVFSTTKSPDELFVAVEFPRRPGYRFFYDEIAQRHGDFPYAGLCLGATVESGMVIEARAAAAAVADVPRRLTALEDALRGQVLAEVVELAAQVAAAEVDPPTDALGTADFRRGLVRTLVRRTLTELKEEAV